MLWKGDLGPGARRFVTDPAFPTSRYLAHALASRENALTPRSLSAFAGSVGPNPIPEGDLGARLELHSGFW